MSFLGGLLFIFKGVLLERMRTINKDIRSHNHKNNRIIFEQQKRLFERLESEKIAFKDLLQTDNLGEIIGLGFSNLDDTTYSFPEGIDVYRDLWFSVNPYIRKLAGIKRLQDGDGSLLNEKGEPLYSIVSDKKLSLTFHQIKEFSLLSTKIKKIDDSYIDIVDFNQAPLIEEIVSNNTLVIPLHKSDYNLIQPYLK